MHPAVDDNAASSRSGTAPYLPRSTAPGSREIADHPVTSAFGNRAVTEGS